MLIKCFICLAFCLSTEVGIWGDRKYVPQSPPPNDDDEHFAACTASYSGPEATATNKATCHSARTITHPLRYLRTTGGPALGWRINPARLVCLANALFFVFAALSKTHLRRGGCCTSASSRHSSFFAPHSVHASRSKGGKEGRDEKAVDNRGGSKGK